jgi:hypothetical protein
VKRFDDSTIHDLTKMLCSICKEKEATVHLTQIVGDKMQNE